MSVRLKSYFSVLYTDSGTFSGSGLLHVCVSHTYMYVYVYSLGVLENALNCGTHAHLCTLHVYVSCHFGCCIIANYFVMRNTCIIKMKIMI